MLSISQHELKLIAEYMLCRIKCTGLGNYIKKSACVRVLPRYKNPASDNGIVYSNEFT